MNKYIVTCCSTVDLSKEILNERYIPFVSFSFRLNDVLYKDDYSYPMDKYFDEISDGAMPTTSQVNVDEYSEFFKKYLDDGYDILHITLSSGISGTLNSCRIASEELNEKYQNKIHFIDSLCCSGGYGMLVLRAKDNLDKGLSLEENYKDIENIRLHISHLFFSSDLSSFVRGGRISKAAGLVGSALQICPLMHVNDEGKLEVLEKIRTKTKAMKMAVDKMEETCDNGLDYDSDVYMSQSGCLEDAKQLEEMIKERFKNVKSINIYNVGTVIGAHTGKGTVALYYYGTERVKI